MSTSRKTVLITGCSKGGIGYELALAFNAKGLRVFATARNPTSMEGLAEYGIETLTIDVCDPASIHAARELVSEKLGGRLNILVNNAGAAYPVAATDFDIDAVKALYEVNVFGVMRMVKEFAPLLVAAEDSRVVNIGSVSGLIPAAYSGAYNSSKAALHSYGDTLRVELAPFGVKVIVTGGVKSNISDPRGKSQKLPEDSLYQPIADIYYNKRLGVSQQNATPTDVYARKVVAEVLNAKPSAWFWIAHLSFYTWFVSTFLPKTGFDSTVSKMFGFDKLAKLVQAQRKTV